MSTDATKTYRGVEIAASFCYVSFKNETNYDRVISRTSIHFD